MPDLTRLQFLILSILMNSRRSGRFVREELAKNGEKKSLASFYQLMARLEEAKLVKGWYETKVIDSQTVKERFYEITATGARSLERTWDFYARSAAVAGLPVAPGAC